MLKKKWLIFLVGGAILLLAGIAVLTATKLYQLRGEPVAPNVPKPAPAAESEEPEPDPACTLNITVLSGPSLTPTPTGRPSATPTPTGVITATPTPKPTSTPGPTSTPVFYGCHRECTADSQCGSGLRCLEVSEVKRCCNPGCTEEPDCICPRSCWDVCGNTNECPSGLECKQADATKRCVESDCEREQDCDCTFHTQATSTPTVYVAQVELPSAGISWPTIFGLLVGVGLALLGLGL